MASDVTFSGSNSSHINTFKAVVNVYTIALAEVKREGIKVNAVAPGSTKLGRFHAAEKRTARQRGV